MLSLKLIFSRISFLYFVIKRNHRHLIAKKEYFCGNGNLSQDSHSFFTQEIN